MSDAVTDENRVAHTPGPWETGTAGDTPEMKLMVYADDALGSRIADCSKSGHGISREQDRANACLIAAAPELLSSLRETLKYLPAHPEDRSLREAVDQAHAAIAKAEGRS